MVSWLTLLLNLLIPTVLSDCSKLKKPPERRDICKSCRELPEHLLECDDVVDLSEANNTYQEEFVAQNGYGCKVMGGEKYWKVETSRVVCRSIEPLFCYYDSDDTGHPNATTTWNHERKFLSKFEKPCIRYTGHYFQTTLIFSLLLGFLGVDRFCLGWTGIGVGKMLTIGGLGIWWIIDIILLITGNLTPNDRSNWETLY